MLQEETINLTSTLTGVENEFSSLNSKLEALIQSERNMLNGMVVCGEVYKYMKRINIWTSMKDQCMNITSTKVVLPNMKIEVQSPERMPQLRVKCSNMKLPLKRHHYGKFGHIKSYFYELHGYPRLDSPSNIMNRRYKKV